MEIMTDDAQVIQAVTSIVADEGKDIVLIMRSYGGVPGTESAHGITKKEREAPGKTGGVVALLCVTAFLVDPGKSSGLTMGEGAAVPGYVNVEVRGAFTFILHIILSSANLDFRLVFSLTLYPSWGDFMLSRQKTIRKPPSPICPCPKPLPGRVRCHIIPPSLSEVSLTTQHIWIFQAFTSSRKMRR